MDEALEKIEKLCAKYPQFKLHPLSFACGVGWFPLIEDVMESLVRLQSSSPSLELSLLEAKEKFGALRLYISAPDGTPADLEAVRKFISQAGERSRTMCEYCSAPAIERCWEGWCSTRCDACFAADERRRKNPE